LQQLKYLHLLRQGNFSYDFWTEPSRIGSDVDIRVSPEQRELLVQELSGVGIVPHVWIKNVQDLMNEERPVGEPEDFFDAYHTYDEVVAWVHLMASTYPTMATAIDIGKSYQGRSQWALKISSPKSGNRPALWLDANIHAREWITCATVTFMAQKLLEDYGKVGEVTLILDNLDIYVLPLTNVDGYAYTWTNDRMWRKTRRPNTGSTCVGTDPNRNWDFHWREAGVSTSPCSDIFCGPHAFSEACALNVANFLTLIKASSTLVGYISFHSYSQLWMTPWGYTDALPKDYGVQNALSAASVAALTKVFGTQYVYGPISTTIYPASGNSVDWVYGVLAVIQSATPELRDKGQYGFLLPAREIKPSGEETYAALKVYARALF